MNSRFKYVPIILLPEVGTGFNHTVLDHAGLSQYSCYTLHQNNGQIPGVRKDQYLTQEYVLATVDIISNLRFVLDKEWITVYGHNGVKTTTNILTELKNQLGRYGRDEHGKLSGKMGGQFHDDLSVAFMMLVFWSRSLEQPVRELNPYYDWLLGVKEVEEKMKGMSYDALAHMRDTLGVANSSSVLVRNPANPLFQGLDNVGNRALGLRTPSSSNGISRSLGQRKRQFASTVTNASGING